jgi:hypothetical protein
VDAATVRTGAIDREVADMEPRHLIIGTLLVVGAALHLGASKQDGEKLVFHGPYQHENLAVFVITGDESMPSNAPIITLAEAMSSNKIIVHETGNVGTLAVENTDDEVAVLIQAGEIVKGGRQDRVLAVDLLVRPKSGRVEIASFCVESGRWSKRAGEDASSFSGSHHMISGKGLRQAVKSRKAQGEVWQEVDNEQGKLSENVGKDVRSARSASSFQLTLEDAELAKMTERYTAAIVDSVARHDDAVGVAVCVNGEFRTADVYGSRKIFSDQWPRLLEAAVHEAIADLDPDNPSPTPGDDWQAELLGTEAVDEQHETASGGVDRIRRTKANLNEYETRDTVNGGVIHQSWDQRVE